MARFDTVESEFQERVIQIRRVTKVVKGGKRMKFRVVVVVGDTQGRVGVGVGKAAEIPNAVRKGIEDAKKSLLTVSLSGSTICLLYTSDAADDLLCVDLGGRRIIK